MGVGPHAPEAPTTVFQVPIECDELNCDSRLPVHVELKSSTSSEEIERLIDSWEVVGVECADHDFQWPPYPHPPLIITTS